ncbi:MAG: WD40 repeat domain-containing protein, partial [Myxococcales bacterium]|nr:WD40 repeat domain-containing protein [Myxococcales bacterium]
GTGGSGGTAGVGGGGAGGAGGGVSTSYPWLMVTSGNTLTLLGIEDLTAVKSAKLKTSSSYHTWSPDGNALLLHDSGNVIAQRVDETGASDRFTVTSTSGGSYPQTAWSRDGQIISAVSASRELRLLPAYQDLPTSTVLTYQAIALEWSPSRNEFLLLNGYPGSDQLCIGLPYGSLRQIAKAGATVSEMSWSDDGDYVLYKTSEGRFLVERSASGTDPGTALPDAKQWSWLPGGHLFVTYGNAPLRLFDASNPSSPTDLTTEDVSGVGVSPTGDQLVWSNGTMGGLVEPGTQAATALTGNPFHYSTEWNPSGSRLIYRNETATQLVYLDVNPLEEVLLVSGSAPVYLSPTAQTAFYAIGETAYLRDTSANPPGTSLPVYSTGSSFVRLTGVGWSPQGDRALFDATMNGSPTALQALKVDGLAVSAPLQIYSGGGTYEWQPR